MANNKQLQICIKLEQDQNHQKSMKLNEDLWHQRIIMLHEQTKNLLSSNKIPVEGTP